jgi:hypothetical protein
MPAVSRLIICDYPHEFLYKIIYKEIGCTKRMIRSTDLWFASYLMLNNYNFSKYEAENGRLTFFFEINENDWKKLKQDWVKMYMVI